VCDARAASIFCDTHLQLTSPNLTLVPPEDRTNGEDHSADKDRFAAPKVAREYSAYQRVPSTAPHSRALTTAPCAPIESLKSFFKKGSTPEMTPTSNPKSRPATAAVNPMK
jgi:hypothetical protein